MKLKITIAGPKVHDVGYRYFLMGLAMSNRIKKFEADNNESDEGQEVQVFVEGSEETLEAFRKMVEKKRPALSEVSNIFSEEYDGEVMRIGEYAQFCTMVQMNKAIPALLEIRNDLGEIKTDTKEIKSDMKAVRKNTDSMPQASEALTEIKDCQPDLAMNYRQMQADIRAIKERLGMQ